MRWAAIGYGDVVEFKSGPALQQAPDSQLLGLTGRNQQRARAFAARFGVERVYLTVDELLADPEVDAVYIATPVDSHCAYTIVAAAAGKHVLVEKPMALNQDECARMIAACRAANVRLGVAYYRRRYPAVWQAHTLLTTGAIGRPIAARAQCATRRNAPTGDDWRLRPAQSIGGSLADIGSHRLDLLLYLLGPARAVSATSNTGPGVAEDAATVIANFANGAQATCGIYWNAGAFCDDLEIIGTDGRLLLSPLEAGELRLYRGDSLVEHWQLGMMRPTHRGLVEDFIAAVREGREPVCGGVDGAATNAFLLGAYASMASGARIALDP